MPIKYSVLLVLLGALSHAAYAWIGTSVDADGVLREAFVLLPLGYAFYFAALLVFLFGRSK